MSDARERYAEQLRMRETRELEEFVARERLAPTALFPEEAKATGTTIKPIPESGFLGKAAGVVGVGAKASYEIGLEGTKHFVKGIWDAVTANPLRGSGPVMSGVGESILGGLTVISALPMGGGVAAQQAMKNFTPGAENSVALSGDSAFSLRNVLTAPLLLDPEIRERLKDPKWRAAMEEEFRKPMTYGELISLIVPFAIGGLPMRYAKRLLLGVRGRTGEVIPTKELVGDIPREARGALPGEVIPPRPTPEAAEFYAGPQRALRDRNVIEAPGAIELTPEAIAARLMIASESLKAVKKTKRKQEVAEFTEETGAARNPVYAQELARDIELATERAEEMLAPIVGERTPRARVIEEVPRAGEAPKVEPEAPKAAEPPKAAEGTVTLRIPRGAKGYAEITFPDKAHADLYTGLARTAKGRTNWSTLGKSFGLDEDAAIAASARYRAAVNKQMRASSSEKTTAQSFKETMGEAGGVDVGLLARMAVGAAIGGTQGDTPEERIAYALAGMGLGAAAVPMAKRLAAIFKHETPRVVDDVNPRIPGYSPPRTVEVPLPRSGDLTTEALLDLERVEHASQWKQIEHIETQATQFAMDTARAIARGDEVVPGTLKRAMEVAYVINEAAHDLRAGAGIREAVRGHATRVHEAMQRINRLIGFDITPETALAQAITAFPREAQVSTFSRLYYALPGAGMQAAYGAMLSGGAIVKNGLANSFMMPLGAVSRTLAAFRPGGGVGLTEGPMGLVAMWEGILNQIRLARSWEALGDQAVRLGNTHMEIQPQGFMALSQMAEEAGFARLSTGLRYLSNVFDTGPNLMMRTDGMSKAVNGDMQIMWEAMGRARREGLTGEAFERRVSEIRNDWNLLDDAAKQRVVDFREHQTFTADLTGRLTGALQRGPTDPMLDYAYRIIGPATFVRTPLQLMQVGMEYTPGLNLAAKHFWQQWWPGGTTRAVAEARLVAGTVMIGTPILLALQGLITGSRPQNADEARAAEAAGRPSESFWNPATQKYHSYSGLEPFSTWLRTGADIATLVARIPEGSEETFTKVEKVFLASIIAMLGSIEDSNFWQGASQFVDVFKRGASDAAWTERILKYLRQRAMMYHPATLREIKKLTDPEQQRVLANIKFDEDKSPNAPLWREVDMLMQDAQRSTPFWAKGVDDKGRLIVKLDRNLITGEPIINDSWPFSPFAARPARSEPWAIELQRLDGAGLRRLPEWLGKKASATLGMEETPTAPGVRLTGDELDRWEVLQTQVVRDAYGTLRESLNHLVQSDIYERQSDITKRDLIQAHFGAFRTLAEVQLLAERPALRRAWQEKRQASQIERLPMEHPLRQPAIAP